MRRINKPITENVSVITNQLIESEIVDDKTIIKIYGNLLIKDKTTNQILLNKRV